MALIGGERGALSFLLLLGDAFLCFLGTLLLSYGVSPAGVLSVGCLLLLVLTVPAQNGFNRKTLTVLLASAILLIPTAAVIGAVCSGAHLVGLDEFQAVQTENSYLSSGVQVNLQLIMLGSLLLGQLGGITDTGMTVVSALHEVRENQPDLPRRELFRAGMQLGRDIIGTTISTLAFIAFGEGVLLCLLYTADGYSLTVVLNSKSFFQQFGGILLSCESCLLVIPLSVWIYLAQLRSPRMPASALVGLSISRIPGPPRGPSYRMTTTSPGTIAPA